MFAGGFDHNGISSELLSYINGKPINSSKDIDLLFAQRGIIQIFVIKEYESFFRYLIIQKGFSNV
jgi:hypothetical protein